VLGKIPQKNARTISRELKRGMVEHVLTELPFSRIEYNSEHAQLDAEERMRYKGPLPKSCNSYFRFLVQVAGRKQEIEQVPVGEFLIQRECKILLLCTIDVESYGITLLGNTIGCHMRFKSGRIHPGQVVRSSPLYSIKTVIVNLIDLAITGSCCKICNN